MKQYWKAALPLLMLPVLAALAFACGDDAESEDEDRVRAVVTIGLLRDLVEQVGGDRVEVEALLPAGADPHTYEPVPSDVVKITQAGIVFANGLGLEEGALRVIEANLPTDVRLVELAEEAVEAGVPVIQDDDDVDDDHADEEHDHEGVNPHLWLDPEVAREYASIIRSELSSLDPEGASDYESSYESYVQELDEAAEYLRNTTASVPEEHRVLVTAHDAFPYLARAIGFEIGAVVTVSPGQEPSPQTVARISRTIEETGVPAVFREPQLGAEADVLEQAAADAGVEVCVLYSDTLEEEAPTYIDLLRSNADEIARCLGDDA